MSRQPKFTRQKDIRGFWALLAIAGLSLVIAACGGSSGLGPTPVSSPTIIDTATPTVGVTPTASVMPTEFINGIAVQALRFGAEVPLPPGLMLLIETGCTQCDGPSTGLAYVYSDNEGKTVRQQLFTGHTQSQGDPGPFITSYRVSEDLSQMAYTLCTRGGCSFLATEDPDDQTTLFYSRDFGRNWSRIGVFDAGYSVAGITQQGLVLAGPFRDANRGRGPFFTYPDGAVIEPPAEGAFPKAVLDGQLLWSTEDGTTLLRSDGSELISLTSAAGEYAHFDSMAGGRGNQPLAISWYSGRLLEPENAYCLFVIHEDSRIEKIFRHGVYARAWLDENTLIANVDLRGYPGGVPFPNAFASLIDLREGIIHPIVRPFIDPATDMGYGRDYVIGVLPRPAG